MKASTRRRIDAETRAAIHEYAKRVVNDAPPLTAEQRDRIALLLRPKPETVMAPQLSSASRTGGPGTLQPAGAGRCVARPVGGALGEMLGEE